MANPALGVAGFNPRLVYFSYNCYCFSDFSCFPLSSTHATQTRRDEEFASQVAIISHTQFQTSSIEEGVERTMDDTLRADVHPAASCHLTIVGHAHFFRNFPVLHIVVFTDQEAISDDNARCFWFGFEESERVARFYNQGLMVCHDFQVFLDQVVLHPVSADRSSFSVGNQFIRIKSDFKAQVVVNHDLHSLSCGTVPFVLINWFAVDAFFWTPAIAINPSASFQFFQKFRNHFLMESLWNIAKGIFKSNFGLSLSQTEAPVRCSTDAFLENRFFR